MSYHLSFQDKLSLQKNYGVVLCTSQTDMGRPFFHYVMADRKAIDQMQRDYESATHVNFTDYGEILLSGWGEKPPAEYEMIISEYFLAN